jgi:L-threonylcarbamoyladenylate synthase
MMAGMTEVIEVNPEHPDPALIARAAARLRAGGLVAFPTETVYGLGVNALEAAAVRRLFEVKGRPSTDPLIVHITSRQALTTLVSDVPAIVDTLAARFWPGPLTLVLRRSALVPAEVTASLDTIGVRIPAHPVAHALITAAGIPVAAPSANLFSRPSPTRAAHVLEDLRGRIDMVIDAGETTVGVESTVLDLTGERPTILRPGAVTPEMLGEVLGRVDVREASGGAPSGPMRSPGLLERHYSPRAPLTLYDGPDALRSLFRDATAAVAAGQHVGLVLASGDLDGAVFSVEREARRHVTVRELGPDLSDVARTLYAALRDLDNATVDVIFARAFSAADGLGLAIADRLRRAAAGRVIHT